MNRRGARLAFGAALALAALPAVATTLATPPHDMPVRTLNGNTLLSPSEPALTIRIDPAFHPLPPLAFPIEALTWAERRIFVDTEGTRVRRMVVMQFEHAQDGSDFRFRYPSTPPKAWGGDTYRFGVYDYDSQKEIALNPGKEESRMHDYFAAQGLTAGRNWRTVRLARVSRDDGKAEIIFFYMEALPDTPMLTTPADDSGADVSPQDKDAAFQRFTAAVSVSHAP